MPNRIYRICNQMYFGPLTVLQPITQGALLYRMLIAGFVFTSNELDLLVRGKTVSCFILITASSHSSSFMGESEKSSRVYTVWDFEHCYMLSIFLTLTDIQLLLFHNCISLLKCNVYSETFDVTGLSCLIVINSLKCLIY